MKRTITAAAAWAAIIAILLSLIPFRTVEADSSFLSWGVEHLEADKLMNLADKPSGSVKVALIDTGVDASNDVLSGRVAMKRDYVNNDDDPDDDNGHGTAMAGVIAEMTRGFDVKIYVYKVFDSSGKAEGAKVIEAFAQARADGCDVLCFPFADLKVEANGFDFRAAYSELAGSMTVCVPAGIETSNLPQSILADSGKDGVIAVSAIKKDGSFYSSGTTGSNVDFAMPGCDVKTCHILDTTVNRSSASVACAHAAGACALAILFSGSSRPANVEKSIKKTCVSAGDASEFGKGVPHLSKLAEKQDDSTPEPTAEPTREPLFTPDPGIMTFGSCGEDCDYALLVDGTLLITGSGKMNDYDQNGAPWLQYIDQVKRVSIDSGIESVGAYAFYMCRYITGVDLPKTVTAIGDHAFAGCTGLSGIELPEELTTIGEEAFYDCTGLKELYIPKAVAFIGADAFKACPDLVLRVEADSYADWYTEKHGIKRELIGEPGATATPAATELAPEVTATPDPDTSAEPTADPGASSQPTTPPLTAAPTAVPSAAPTATVPPTVAPSKEPVLSDARIDIGIRLTHMLEVSNAKEVEWASANNAVARVTNKGIVTGMSEGWCYIFAYADGRRLQCEVHVHRPELDRTAFKVGLGAKTDISVKYNYGEAKFSSSNKKIFKVNRSGRVTALKKGKAKLTVEVDGYTLKANVTVVDNKCTYKPVNDKTEKVHIALKKLEINKKKLKATVTVYNNTGKKLKTIKRFRLSVYDKKGGNLIAASVFKNQKVNIKKGGKQKLTMTFKKSKLKKKYFDLPGAGESVYITIEELKY